jgi:hypothetical protein
MSRETEVKAILQADVPLMALLTGGIYTAEEVGVEGFRREEGTPTEDAFDADGYLLPCAMIREGSIAPYGNLRDAQGGFLAVSQAVMIYYYQFRGHDVISQARDRVLDILEGTRLGRSYPIWTDGSALPVPDTGPVMNSTTIVQAWQVVSTKVLA